jgi:MarR family transcriptional regulator, organic hydroperoxide resistance regulator
MILKDSFIFGINQMNRFVTKQLDSSLSTSFITSTQLFTLMAIKENPDFTITKLCKLLEADRTTVSRSMVILSRYGFIKSNKNKEDTRSSLISLTKKGYSIIEECIDILKFVDDKMFDRYKAHLVLISKWEK